MSDPQSTVTLVIDGRSVTAPKGENLVEAAKRVGVDIPVFCYHPKLSVVGACRMCLVEVEKSPKPVAACAQPVAEGMVVHTQSKKALDARGGVIEFLLANHPLDCPICDKGGECPLQDNSYRNGPPVSRFREAKRDVPIVTLSPLVMLDMERCIQCYRCTRFSSEVAGDAELAFVNRGADIMIAPLEGNEYRSVYSGNVVEICPVGALMSRPYRFKARPWDLQGQETVCTLCACGCSIKAHLREEGDPVAARVGTTLAQLALGRGAPPGGGAPVAAINAGPAGANPTPKHARVIRYYGRENDDVNEGWLCDRGRYGFDATRGADRLTWPMMRRAREERLAPVSWDEAFARVAEGFGAAGGAVGALLSPHLTLEEAYLAQKLVRGLGSQNVDARAGWAQAQPAVLARAGWLGSEYAALEKAGAIVLVATDLKEELPIAALRVRKAALRGVPLVVAHWRPVRPPARGATFVAYVPGEEASLPGRLRGLPQVAGAKGPVHVIVGEEVLRAPLDAAALLDGLAALAPSAVVGLALRGPNARGVLEAGGLPGWLPGMRPAPAGGLDARGMLEAAAAGRLKALYCVGADPVTDFPDCALARRALEAVPFLVVQELYPTATARPADVVLPAAGFDEKDGVLMNVERRLQRVRRLVDAPGLAMPDGKIITRVAGRLGLGWAYGAPADVWAEMHREAPSLAPTAGVADIPRAGTLLAPPSVSFAAAPGDRLAPEVPRRAEVPVGSSDSRFPLRVAVGRMLYDGGTLVGRSKYLAGVMPKPFVAVNPADASRLRVADRAEVTAVSAAGRLPLLARVTAEVPAGVAYLPLGFAEAPVSALGDPTRGIAITLEPAP
jgi:NADH-quinone oxidoreductase subunit G